MYIQTLWISEGITTHNIVFASFSTIATPYSTTRLGALDVFSPCFWNKTCWTGIDFVNLSAFALHPKKYQMWTDFCQ